MMVIKDKVNGFFFYYFGVDNNKQQQHKMLKVYFFASSYNFNVVYVKNIIEYNLLSKKS